MTAPVPLQPNQADLADLAAVRSVLGAAFADDPMFQWVFSDGATRAHGCAGWLGLFVEAFAAHGTIDVVRDDGRIVGVALWRLDDRSVVFPDLPSVGGMLAALLGPERAAVVGAGLGAFAENKPAPPFHYLQFLAVHPQHQGAGHGRQLVAAGQARATHAGVGIYLESTNPANLAFYRSLGLGQLGEFTLQPDGPRAYRLWWSP